MMDFSDGREIVAQGLKNGGFRGRKGTWRLIGDDVQWVIHFDHPPSRNRIAIDVGLDLQVGVPPARPADCPILFGAENLPFGQGIVVRMALDLDSGLGLEERRTALNQLAVDLSEYLHQRSSQAAVRRAYRAGELKSALIRKDTRAALEGEDPHN